MTKIARCFAIARVYERTARKCQGEAIRRDAKSRLGESFCGKLTGDDYWELADSASYSAKLQRIIGIKLINGVPLTLDEYYR